MGVGGKRGSFCGGPGPGVDEPEGAGEAVYWGVPEPGGGPEYGGAPAGEPAPPGGPWKGEGPWYPDGGPEKFCPELGVKFWGSEPGGGPFQLATGSSSVAGSVLAGATRRVQPGNKQMSKINNTCNTLTEELPSGL